MRPRPNSTSTASLTPEATSVAVVDPGSNVTTLPVLRNVGNGSGLGDVDRVARDGQPGRDDVAERDQLGNLAIAGDPQHPVVVPVGDEEPAAEGFDRVLEAGGDEERGCSADWPWTTRRCPR